MDDAEKKTKISQFSNVTGVPEDRAQFYLESAKWQMDLAVANFFDVGDEPMDTPPRTASPVGPGSQNPSQSSAATSSGTSQPSHGRAAQQQSRFATLGSLRNEGSDSSDEEGQAFYAGGSEHGGGQQILGPSRKKKRDTESIIKDVFKAAKEHGAEVAEPSAASSQQPAAFQGRAYRLGDTEAPSEVVASGYSQRAQQSQVDMVLKMWKNGFSVNDGPLREFNAPENMRFLEEIRHGDVPHELIQMARGGEVNLNIEDHGHEDYVKPPTVVRAFTGEGHRLGCPSDPVTVANATAHSMAAPPATQQPAEPARTAEPSVALDPSQPTTSLQIRLANGSRLVAKFNHSHRISDLRQYIITARPEYATANFILMTTFPNAELTDETLTLADGKLLNAVIVQRIR